MIEGLRNAIRLPDIRNKILFTLLIVLIYQFAAHVPVVGVDRDAMRSLIENQGGLFGVLNLLSGGALANFSVIANGVYPYITASIILQVLTPVIPQLEALSKEPGGKEKMETYTYYLAVPFAILQAISQIQIFSTLNNGQQIIPGFGSDILLTITVIVTMTAGTMLAVWLGNQITEQGIGNGLSIIIFSGIIARAPSNLIRLLTGSTQPLFQLVLFVVITLVGIVGVVLVQEGVRRIPVQYGKRVRGRRQYGGASTHIPLKVNSVGMIPLIFAQSIITFPALLAGLFPDGPVRQSITATFGQQQGGFYWATFFLLVFGFTYIYSDIMVGNQDLADNLQRNGGFIPGIRPGRNTQVYISRVVRRITFVGALFLGIVAIAPGVVDFINRLLFPTEFVSGSAGNAAQVLSGSGMIIVVGVVIDTLRQLEAQLVMRNYDRFMR
ncbi:MAG: preprotein translocase subunit SecY [Chloroflexi bacterium]|uniref:preprotein translocase subunit SecY n=1 Tax=Candidatus Flexifilum breve TaxID=3140694 RepID=UPI00313476A5|nr:preprotein translocase subunit SecY [Chloroflexota bacterium]